VEGVAADVAAGSLQSQLSSDGEISRNTAYAPGSATTVSTVEQGAEVTTPPCTVAL
jgi:hypothetical protein